MIKLSFLVVSIFLSPSCTTPYYSSSGSSSEIIGYSPEFLRLFPQFKDASNSYTSTSISSTSSGHKEEKHSKFNSDGFTRSESAGFKHVKPASADEEHSGSSQTSPQAAYSSRDDVLLPKELAEFWTSQLITTPAPGSYQQSLTLADGFRQAENVVYSGYSRTPGLQEADGVYAPSSVSAGYSQLEDESHTYTSSYTPDDDSRKTPSPVSDGYRLEVKADGYSGRVPVVSTSSSSHGPRPGTGGHSVGAGSTASRSRAAAGKKNNQSPPDDDGYTLVKAKSQFKLAADGYTLEESNPPVQFSSINIHFKDSQSKHDLIGTDPIFYSKTTTVKPIVKTTTVEPLSVVKTTTVEPLSVVKTTTVKPVPVVKTTTVKPVPALKTTTDKPLPVVKTTTVKPTVKTTTIKPLSVVKTTTVKPLFVVKTTTVKPLSVVKTTTVKAVPVVKTTTVKPVPVVKTTTVKPGPALKTPTDKPLPVVKATTVKPVSAGFFSKFNNGGNFAIQRPKKIEDHKSSHSGEASYSSPLKSEHGQGEGVLAYLVSEEGNPGSDFLLTKSALIQSGLVFNKVVRMSANTVDAAGQVEILDSKSFHLTGLRYAGLRPARWIAGTTFPVGLYSDTVVLASWAPGVEEVHLALPGQVTVADISWLALYCSSCAQGRVVMQVYIPETFL